MFPTIQKADPKKKEKLGTNGGNVSIIKEKLRINEGNLSHISRKCFTSSENLSIIKLKLCGNVSDVTFLKLMETFPEEYRNVSCRSEICFKGKTGNIS